MNCQEALNLLYDIIDKEASEIDEQAVRQHIEHCRHCSEIYRVENTVNEFLHAKLHKNTPSPKLESLKNKILDELDSIDGRETGHKKKVNLRSLTLVLAAAASLVLLLTFGFLASDFYKHRTNSVPFEKAHWTAANDVSAYADQELTSATMNDIVSRLRYELSPKIDNFELIGGNLKEIMGVPMGHFLYSDGRRTVSVFIAPASEFAIPPEVLENAVSRGEQNVYDHFCRGCRLVFSTVGDAVVVTATTEKDVELLDFVPGHSVI